MSLAFPENETESESSPPGEAETSRLLPHPDHDLDPLDTVAVIRYRPESVQSIIDMTKFSKKEIQLMYRGFKQGCPSGVVTLETFKEIYAQFFPQGDASNYAEFVFNSFDRDQNGTVSFEEFVMGLSVLSRGSIDEKLEWIFNLYDVQGRGEINWEDVYTVVQSIYEMMGNNTKPPINNRTIVEHTNLVYKKMDKHSLGLITKEQFLQACKDDDLINESLHLFDTII